MTTKPTSRAKSRRNQPTVAEFSALIATNYTLTKNLKAERAAHAKTKAALEKAEKERDDALADANELNATIERDRKMILTDEDVAWFTAIL